MGIHKRHLNHHEDGDEGTLSPSYRSLGLPSPRRKHAQSHWEWFYGACGRLLMLVVRKRIITLAALGTVLLVLILRRGNRLWCSLVKSKRKVLADEEGFQFPYQPYQSTHLDEEAFRRDVNTCATSFKLSQVGLLFLTHGRIPNEGTWKHWFSLAQDQVSIPHSVLHDCLRGSKSVSIGTDDVSKRCELNHKTDNVIDRQYLFDVWVHLGKDIDDAVYEGSIFKSKLIPRSKRVEARWGSHSLIDATRVLFAAALTNPFVTKLTLVSESDVPLYGPSLVYSQLLSESKSRINACNTTKHWDRNQYRLRYDFQEAGITWEIWRKSWQWIALTRGHASVVVRDTQIDAIFRKLCRPRWDHDWCDFRVCYSDEHYISTLLAIRGLDNETDCRGELTDRDWSRVKSTDAHPYQYRRKDITKELFHNLRHPEMVGCERSDFIQETVSQEFVNLSILREEGRDVKQSMCDWPQLNTVSSFSPLGSHCPLLARKFANETADMIETLAPFIFAHVSDDSPPLLGQW